MPCFNTSFKMQFYLKLAFTFYRSTNNRTTRLVCIVSTTDVLLEPFLRNFFSAANDPLIQYQIASGITSRSEKEKKKKNYSCHYKRTSCSKGQRKSVDIQTSDDIAEVDIGQFQCESPEIWKSLLVEKCILSFLFLSLKKDFL